jgi:TRAP-type C4-dicarboxylate transport system substrate-binding protein
VDKLRIAVLIGLVLVLAFIPVLGACGEEVTPPPPAEEEEEEPPEEPIVLRWGSPVTSTTDYTYTLVEDAAKAIETRTGGRVIVEVYPAGTVCPAKELATAVITGVLDIGWVMLGYNPGLCPKSELLSLPLVWPTGEDRFELDYEVLYPEIIEPEWEDAGLIFLGYPSPSVHQLFTTDKPVRSLDDLKGLKVCSNSEQVAEILAALGAAATVLPGADTYMALEQGVAEGSSVYLSSGQMSKYEEVCHFITLIDFGKETVGFWAGNPITFNETLSPELAEIVKEEVVNAGKARQDYTDLQQAEALQFFIDQGFEVFTLSAEEHALLRQLAETFVEAWIEEQENAGMKNAREFADYLLELFE